MHTYVIPLLPYIKLCEEHEAVRASKARTRTKIRNIPVKFVSVNDMYPINRFGHGKRLSDAGRIYKSYIYGVMQDQDSSVPPTYNFYECAYVFYMTHDMLFTNQMELRAVDVSNMIKAAEDAVFEYLLDNDCKVIDIHGFKRLTLDDPKLVVMVGPAGDDASGTTSPIKFGSCSFNSYELENGRVLPS